MQTGITSWRKHDKNDQVSVKASPSKAAAFVVLGTVKIERNR